MDVFNLLLDPVVLFALSGLLILLGIGAYYIYYFLDHIQGDK